MKKGDVMLYSDLAGGNFHVEIMDPAPNEYGAVTVRRLYDGATTWACPRDLYERLAAREEAMKTEWRKQDGYHEEHQLVEMPADRIIGVVGGSVYRPFDGSTADRLAAATGKGFWCSGTAANVRDICTIQCKACHNEQKRKNLVNNHAEEQP